MPSKRNCLSICRAPEKNGKNNVKTEKCQFEYNVLLKWPKSCSKVNINTAFAPFLLNFTLKENMRKMLPKNQRWSNIFGFNSDSNLFPWISNIRIRIRQFFSPNIIRIFESFSSNLEYSDSDSTIFELEYYSNIRIFFLESRIFETYFVSEFWI